MLAAQRPVEEARSQSGLRGQKGGKNQVLGGTMSRALASGVLLVVRGWHGECYTSAAETVACVRVKVPARIEVGGPEARKDS